VPVAICGEMAGEPVYVLILLGLGLGRVQHEPGLHPKVKKILRRLRFDETRDLVEHVFQFSRASEIEAYIRRWMTQRFPKG